MTYNQFCIVGHSPCSHQAHMKECFDLNHFKNVLLCIPNLSDVFPWVPICTEISECENSKILQCMEKMENNIHTLHNLLNFMNGNSNSRLLFGQKSNQFFHVLLFWRIWLVVWRIKPASGADHKRLTRIYLLYLHVYFSFYIRFHPLHVDHWLDNFYRYFILYRLWLVYVDELHSFAERYS